MMSMQSSNGAGIQERPGMHAQKCPIVKRNPPLAMVLDVWGTRRKALSRRDEQAPNNQRFARFSIPDLLSDEDFSLLRDKGSRIRLSPVPPKNNAPEPDQWPYPPPFAPRVFYKSRPIRKMVGRGGGDRTQDLKDLRSRACSYSQQRIKTSPSQAILASETVTNN